MLGTRELLAQFKAATFRSPAEIEAFVQAAGPVGSSDLVRMLEVLCSRGAGADPAHADRCAVFARLCEQTSDKQLFAPFVRALRVADPLLRSVLLAALPRVNNPAGHLEVCALLDLADPASRRLAVEILAPIAGRTAFEALRERVEDPSFKGRAEAVEIVARAAGHHAIPVLQAVLKTGSVAEKVDVLGRLPGLAGKDPDAALAAVSTALADPCEEVLVVAIGAFGALAPDEETWFQAVGPLLDSERPAVCCAAVAGLGRFQSARAIEALEGKIAAGPDPVRLAALEALAEIGSDAALPGLARALALPQAEVRLRAAQLLVRLAREARLDRARALVCLLRSKDSAVQGAARELVQVERRPDELWPKVLAALRGEDWWARERALEQLAAMAGAGLTRALVAMLSDGSDVFRRSLLDAIGRLRDPRALRALMRVADSDPDWWAREKALEAIGAIGDARALPGVLDLMTRHQDLQQAGLRALQALGAKSAAPRVEALLAAGDPDVRRAAVECLAAFDERGRAAAIAALQNDPDRGVQAAVRETLTRWAVPIERAATSRAAAYLDRMLVALAASGGDDLIVAPDRCATMKRLGRTTPFTRTALSLRQVEAMLRPMLTPAQAAELERRREIDLSWEVRPEGLRFRANVFLSMTGISAVFRIIRKELPELEKLGLPKIVGSFGELGHGLVLVGGATGSGKSTTLAALIDSINRTSRRHILSIEDPIEVVHRGRQSLVSQREIGVHAASFESALRAALREDPDVILVGELRDLATISFAVTAAETGHLVFGTIHTTSADGAVDRLINAFPPGQQQQVRTMLAQSLRAVVCQNLIKRADGSGRVAAVEVMLNTDAVANLIRKGKTFQLPTVIATSRELGMQSMDDDLQRLLDAGCIAAEDAWLKARDKSRFAALLAPSADPGEITEPFLVAAPAATRTASHPVLPTSPTEPIDLRAAGLGPPSAPTAPGPVPAASASPSAPVPAASRPAAPVPAASRPAAAALPRPARPNRSGGLTIIWRDSQRA